MNQKDEITKYVMTQLGIPIDDVTVKKATFAWWQNPRRKDQGGFRLSDKGYEFLKRAEIKDYEIRLPKNTEFNSQLIIWLDKFVDCPFYITKKSIFVFGERMAVQLILFSGDIQKYGWSRARSVAKSQLDEA